MRKVWSVVVKVWSVVVEILNVVGLMESGVVCCKSRVQLFVVVNIQQPAVVLH